MRSRGGSDVAWISRSEEMCLAQLFLQTDAAYNCVAQLGLLGCVQFRDLNPGVSSFQRKYVNEVRRCDEMERKLRFLEREIKKEEIMMSDIGECPEAPAPREISDLEATLEKLDKELREVSRNEERMKKQFFELTELRLLLCKTHTFFEEMEHERRLFIERGRHPSTNGQLLITTTDDDEQIYSRGISLAMLRLRFVCGVIERKRMPTFEKLLWRACRGNVFLKTSDIDDVLNDTVTGEPVNKTVFTIFFQGDQLSIKVKKICEGFHATLYSCPDTPQERRELSSDVTTRIEDLKIVLAQTQRHKHTVLAAASKNLWMWLRKVRKIKLIYHTLNLFNVDVTQKCLIAEVWCPIVELERIKVSLKRGTDESGSQVPSILKRLDTRETPPTFNRTNKYTRGFQNIVDSYGIATYREINPAPYTIISFPFLFSVMFGDMGHGLLMLTAALFFILKERQFEAAKIKDEIFETFFGGRYVIFLMGAFSIYAGLLYNDVFSKSLAIFDSSWVNHYRNAYENGEEMKTLWPDKGYLGSPYPIGVDPVWNLAETNKLNFLNSLKMKMSILIGIAHMAFGLILSFCNYKHFHSDLDIQFVFIPQLLFLSCIFGYLCLQILIKWIFFTWEPGTIFGYSYPGGVCAPSLLIGLINMFMTKERGKGFISEQGENDAQCFQNYWYPGQKYIEVTLICLAAVAVIVLLFAKPLLEWRRHRLSIRTIHISPNPVCESSPIVLVDDGVEMVRVERVLQHTPPPRRAAHSTVELTSQIEFDVCEALVVQSIHTIEFVLGCVSHTASYLRLWALSLAHAQLSEVLWSFVLRPSFQLSVSSYPLFAPLATFFLFALFFLLTFFILVLMEGLSAFLHSLRLHWVEFQSKFYIGGGYPFVSFSLQHLEADVSENSLLEYSSCQPPTDCSSIEMNYI